MYSPTAALLLCILLITAESCKTKSDSIIPAFNNYAFDTNVISRLPLYDSLAIAISQKITLFHKNISEDASYHAFRYMPASSEPEVFKSIPAEIGINVNRYFALLGKNFIYAFDVFKDSTIKIYIRSGRIENAGVDTEENLSYYPKETIIRRRDYPVKDTILNPHWQYWVHFDKEGLF